MAEASGIGLVTLTKEAHGPTGTLTLLNRQSQKLKAME